MNSTNPNKLLFVLVSFFAVSISTAMADSVEASSTHSIASSMPSSPPAVHIVYTETPPDENPKDFHIRTLASALGRFVSYFSLLSGSCFSKCKWRRSDQCFFPAFPVKRLPRMRLFTVTRRLLVDSLQSSLPTRFLEFPVSLASVVASSCR